MCVCVCAHAQMLSHVQFFATRWTVAHQAPLAMEFYQQEYWNGLPFPPLGIFLTRGSNLGLPHFRQTLYCLSHQGSFYILYKYRLLYITIKSSLFLKLFKSSILSLVFYLFIYQEMREGCFYFPLLL